MTVSGEYPPTESKRLRLAFVPSQRAPEASCVTLMMYDLVRDLAVGEGVPTGFAVDANQRPGHTRPQCALAVLKNCVDMEGLAKLFGFIGFRRSGVKDGFV